MQLPKTSIHARDLKSSDDLAGVETTRGSLPAFDLGKSRNTRPFIHHGDSPAQDRAGAVPVVLFDTFACFWINKSNIQLQA